MSKDRFDLEMDISYCRNVVDDIDMLYENILDNPKFVMPPETEDRIANALLGIKELYNMRFERLDDTFNQVFELNEYHKDDIQITDYTDQTMNDTVTVTLGDLPVMDSDVDLWNTHNTIVTGDYDKQLELKFT
jgi:hypothetical protein